MSMSTRFIGIPTRELDQVVDLVGSRWEQLRGQRLLLTGGTGFIGKWLLSTFLYANRQLNLSANAVVLSRRVKNFIADFPDLRDCADLVWLNGDVRELSTVTVGECSYAIHAATDVVTTSTPADVLDTCVIGTRRVLEVMALGSTKRRMLLLSSGAVYGRTPPEVCRIPEDWLGAPNPLDPASAYGEGKRTSELLCSIAVAACPHLEVSIARCFAFVGPHLPLDKHFAIGNFIGAAMHNKDIHVQGDGTPLRSYLYTSDMAYWLWTMLFDAPSGRAYNVGGTESLSISELAHRVSGVLGSTGSIKIAQKQRIGVAAQAYVPSLNRAIDELNLRALVDLDEAILRTAAWHRSSSRSMC